ncbi:MAG: flagellar motor switch protein FliG [Treponemataceae bacterium]
MSIKDERINRYKSVANFSAKTFTADEVAKNNAAVMALKEIEIEEAKQEIEKRFQNKKSNLLSSENSNKNANNSEGQRSPQARGFQQTSIENLTAKDSETTGFIPLNFGKIPAFFSNEYKKNLANKKPPATQKNQERTIPPQTQQKNTQQNFAQKTPEFTRQDLNDLPFQKTTMPTQLDNDFIKNQKSIIKNESLNTFIKTTTIPKPQGDKKDSSVRRVAKFLLLIGNDEAARILPHLPQDQIEKIIAEISVVDRIDEEEALDILQEFESLVKSARESGGLSTARTILQKAFGDEKAEKFLSKTVPFQHGKPFEYLQKMEEEHIFLLLKDEPETIRALVLSHLPSEKSAAFIKQLDKKEQKEVIHRLAKLQKLDTDMVRRVDQSIAQKAQKIQETDIYRFDGKNALAEILRKMSPDMESSMLTHLNHIDPNLEKDLRSRLFTIDDIVDTADDFIQKRLSLLKDEQIALLIAGKKQEFRDKILKNVSSGRGAIILEEESLRKPIPKKEVDEITNQFFIIFKNAWEKGELHISNRNDDIWIE